MKKFVSIIVVVILLACITFVWVANSSPKEVKRVLPHQDSIPTEVAAEIPNLYVEKQQTSKSYAYIFSPKEYDTQDVVYVLFALGDVELDFRINEDTKTVELIPLYYPKLVDGSIVWDSKDFGDESEELSYRFTMHSVSLNNADEYDYEFVLVEDGKKEVLIRQFRPGGGRGAFELPDIMKQRT